MNAKFKDICADARVRLVAELAERFGIDVFLVGGCLRDVVLGRQVKDFDFALSGAEEDLPSELARRSGGHFFLLDRERRHSRVVTGKGENVFTIDFAPFQGAEIGEDLVLRDFTINALALSVTKDACRLLDPLSGMKDMKEGRVRACGPDAFSNDPLRLFRAVRFASTLGFSIESGTWREMVKNSPLLDRVSGERIRDELFLILQAGNVGASLEKLRGAGLLSMIMPPAFHKEETLSDLEARIAFAVETERIMVGLHTLFPEEGEKLHVHLERLVEGNIPIFAILKFAAFLSGRNESEYISFCSERLRLGTKARAELKALCASAVGFPSLPGDLEDNRVPFRFFRDRSPAGPELLIPPLAAGRIGLATAACLTSYYFRDYRSNDADLLLSGRQVMELLHIPPGPRLGKVMESLREAESLGHVSTPDEARVFLLKTVDKRRPIG